MRADPLEEEAARWVARLGSEDATPADRAAFEAWRAGDPRRAEAFAEFERLWGELRETPIPPARLGALGRRRAGGRALLLLAGLALAALAGPEALLRLRADARAGAGEIRHLTLPDGSLLDLDTGAAVAFDFAPDRRRVIVLRGAVFAEARPDPARPFTLETEALTARALGTRFGVDGAEVVVTRDVVEARGGGAEIRLTAGEGAALRDGRFAPHAVRPEETAWREGLLVVSGQPLGTVLAELGRYQRGGVLLLDRAAAARPVSGVFDLRDPAEAFAVLAEGMGLGLTRLPGLVILR